MTTRPDLARLGLLPLAAFALAACASAPPDADTGSGDVPVIEPPAEPSEPEVTYSQEVERIPQRDGSVIIVTTNRGSDGTVWIDEEVIPPGGSETNGPSRGITGYEPTPMDPAEIERQRELDELLAGGDRPTNQNIEPFPGAPMSTCDPAQLDYDFSWPPPEPSARIEIPRGVVVAGIEEGARSVNRIQLRVQAALENAGYTDQAYYTIGCDGFAIITRMEQIDRNGEPLDEGMRFTTPGEDETWSLTGYLTRLFYAPPGFYRQIILAGTDEVYDEDNLDDAPDEARLEAMFAAGERVPIALDASELWGPGHKLHALIYEFETRGTRDVKQRRPSPIPAEQHVEAAGIYEDLD